MNGLSICRGIAVLGMLVTLSACGGGGGGGDNGQSASLSLDRTTVDLESALWYKPADTPITATVNGSISGTVYVLITPSNPNIATVSEVTISNGQGQARIVAGDPQLLGPGKHTTTITVQVCVDDPTCMSGQLRNSPQTIVVNYAVSGIVSDADQGLAMEIGNERTAGDGTRNFTLKGYPDQMAFTTETVLADWLTVTPPTTVNDAVQVSFNEAMLDDMESGTYDGAIRFVPTGFIPVNPQPLVVPVRLTVARTRVSFVTPHVITSGTPTQVTIKAESLSKITLTGITAGSTPLSTVIEGDGETYIKVMTPALAAGSYPIHINNVQGIDRTFATLEVRDATAYSNTVLSYPMTDVRGVTDMLYDPASRSLYVGLDTNSGGRLLRYHYNGSSWDAPVNIALAYPHGFAIGASGNTLFTSEGGTEVTIAERDPETLQERRHTTVVRSAAPTSMSVAFNGRVLVTLDDRCCTGDRHPVLIYSERSPGKIVQDMLSMPTPLGVEEGRIGMSPDGLFGILTTRDQQIIRYDAKFLGWMPFDLAAPNGRVQIVNERLSISRSEARFYDMSQIPIAVTTRCHTPFSISLGVELGPVSENAYFVDFTVPSLRVFTSGTWTVEECPEQAAIPLHANPGAAGGYSPQIRFTPDERTVFVAGAAGVVVQAVP